MLYNIICILTINIVFFGYYVVIPAQVLWEGRLRISQGTSFRQKNGYYSRDWFLTAENAE